MSTALRKMFLYARVYVCVRVRVRVRVCVRACVCERVCACPSFPKLESRQSVLLYIYRLITSVKRVKTEEVLVFAFIHLIRTMSDFSGSIYILPLFSLILIHNNTDFSPRSTST